MRLAAATVSVLALAAAACGELPDPSNIVDLRVLAVKCEPAGFLVNLDNPGMATDAELEATLTALVVDPTGGGQLHVSAVGCPDYIDTITSATLQGSKLCPPASVVSQLPPAIGELWRRRDRAGTTPVRPGRGRKYRIRPDGHVRAPARPGRRVLFAGSDPDPGGRTEHRIQPRFRPRRDRQPRLRAERPARGGDQARGLLAAHHRAGDAGAGGAGAEQEPDAGRSRGSAAPEILLYSHRDETNGLPDSPVPRSPSDDLDLGGDKLYVDPVDDKAARDVPAAREQSRPAAPRSRRARSSS